jgi:phospholipase D1/2
MSVRAERVSYLIDADAYFRALVAALLRAERSVFILGWDVDARTRLPDPWHRGQTLSLRRLLDRLARRRPRLRIRVLGWDFAPLFALERQPFPRLHLGLRTHPHVVFVADAQHPHGASHHQKVVVIDDAIAFSGGIDLAVRRWDTPAHDPHDRRRQAPSGEIYHPFHDVQIAVSGPAARRLGAIARERWRRATGEVVPWIDSSREGTSRSDPWPPDLLPDGVDVRVQIARTVPALAEGDRAIEDVLPSMLAQIAAARRWIYVENQYFSCDALADALARRLDEPDGPEVLLVAPRCCSGWLEERTMGVLRRRFMARVRSAAHAAERFRTVAPFVDGQAVFVHAKVMVVDDTSARIGSANWSRRSMALDTECDVSVVAGEDQPAAGRLVASLRNRLLAEHLGRSEAEIAAELERDPSLVRLVDRGGVDRHELRRLDDPPPAGDDGVLASLADPERPLDPARVAKIFGRVVAGEAPLRAGWMSIAAAATFGLALAATLMMAVR